MAASSTHHPYVYADSEDSFPSNLICAVCHDVCGTHSACPGCQQTFCEVCVHKWFDVQRNTGSNCTCPYCRRKLRFSDLTHDPAIHQQLEQLAVLCPNAPAGCPAILPRADLPAHLQHSCPYESVSCSFCGRTGARSVIQKHESSSCSKRLVPCTHAAAGCAAMVPLDDMVQHVELNCSFACRPCPNCRTAIPRCAWSGHLQHSCPAQRPCPMRLYGCSFAGNSAAVAAHSSSCAYKPHKQQLQDKLGLSSSGRTAASTAAAGSQAAKTAAALEAAAAADSGELSKGCVPDAAAAFKASTAHSSDCQVRQILLESLPDTVIPPRLQQQQQQQQQSGGGMRHGLQGDTRSSLKQLATITPPKVFAAATDARHAISSADPQANSSTPSSSGSCSSSSVLNAADLLGLGAPGCLASIGLHPDPLLECSWRVLLNMAVAQVMKVQETATDQQLSAFMLYSSICRSWDTVRDFSNTVSSAASPQDQWQEQGQQQQQQSTAGAGHQQQQQPVGGAAPGSSAGAATQQGMLASVGALLSHIGSTQPSRPQSGSGSQQEQQQQQQQARQLLTGRQIWARWLSGSSTTDDQQQQQQQQPPPQQRGSNDDSSSNSDSSGEHNFDDPNDGMPGLQRGLYEDESSAMELWLLKTQPGQQLMSTAAAAVYALCLWLSVGGPCFAADVAAVEGISQMSQLASYRVGSLMVKLMQYALKRLQGQMRKQQQKKKQARDSSSASGTQAGVSQGAGAAAAAGPSSSGTMPLAAAVQGLGSSRPLFPRELVMRRGKVGGSPAEHQQQGQQQQQRKAQDVQKELEGCMQTMEALLREAVAVDPSNVQQRLRINQILQQATQQCVELALAVSGPKQLTMPGQPYAAVQQRLREAAAGEAVPEDKYIPRWLWGLRPLVAVELCSALLVLHGVRADQCEVSMIPGVNTHVAHGYRGYWALSVLAGVEAWLGPGFKLSWQAVAAVNDMVVLLVEELCQVLGDSFFDPAEERVPMSPAMALEAAWLVLPPCLLEGGLPHLLRLSASYRDVSCEDLSEVTWEQLARKLGLVAELDKMVSHVNEILPVTFMGEDEYEDESEDDEDTSGGGMSTDSESSSDDSEVDTDESSEDESSHGEGTVGSYETDYGEEETETDEYEQSSYATDEGSSGSDGWDGLDTERAVYESWLQGVGRQRDPEIAAAVDRNAQPSPAAAAAGGGASSSRRGTSKRRSSGNGSEPEDGDDDSSSGEWESADEEEVAALLADAPPTSPAARPAAAAAAGTVRSSGSSGRGCRGDAAAAGGSPATAGRSVKPGSRAGVGAAPSPKSWPLAGLMAEMSQQEQAEQQQQQQQQQRDGDGEAGTGISSAAAAAAGGGASSGVTSESVDWRQQWVSNLAGLSESAAAGQGQMSTSTPMEVDTPGTAAAAAGGSAVGSTVSPAGADASQQQQQQQGSVDGVLSPHTAHLLQQACEVARKQPDQLLLQGSLALEGGLRPGSNAGDAADPAAGDAGMPSTTALYLRSTTLPPSADAMAQATAAAGAAAQGAPAAAAAAAGGTAGTVGETGTSSTADGAAAGGSNAALRWDSTQPPVGDTRQQQQQQQQRQPKDAGEPGDACTHGVALLVGLIEVVLKKLLQSAGRIAAADPELLRNVTSSSSSSSSGGGGSSSGSEGVSSDGGVLLLQSVQARVVVTAKHVQLAVAQDEDLTELLLQDWPGAPVQNAVSWAGAAPSRLDSQLLPDPATEPLAAFLLDLAQGTWQQHQQQQRQLSVQQGEAQQEPASGGSADGCCAGLALLFPGDLRVYCGCTVSAAPPAVPIEAKPAAAASAAAEQCEGPSATCCFMSGWQCSSCAAETAGLAAAGLEAQLDACKQGLQQAMQSLPQQQQQRQHGVSVLREDQLQQLLTGTRLFHLQQPYWFASSSSSSLGNTQQAHSNAPLMDDVDRAQLQQMQPLLQPLRDIVALREAHLQQQQSGTALPAEYFDQLVQDTVCDVLMRRQEQQQQEEQVREQLRKLMGPSASSAAAAAGVGMGWGEGGAGALRSPTRPVLSSPGRTPGRGAAGPAAPSTATAAAAAGSSQGVDSEVQCDLSMQADAMQLLQQAAEDFLVQQLSSANRLTLHAGRQEVGPQDLRLALMSSGYGHMVPGAGARSRAAAAGPAARAGVGSSGKRHRRLGAGILMP